MLILSRKPEESIVIDDEIVITILAIEGEKVKIGISAPRHVRVLRQELWQAIREQNEIAQDLVEKPESQGIEQLRQYLSEALASEEDEETPGCGEEEQD